MYINNLTGKPIKEISFAGYYFTIPAGVSVCWDKFGEFLFKDIYKIDGQGGGVLPVVKAIATQWKGDKYVEVKRFPLNSELIPGRRDLVRIAKQRGVDKVTLEQWDEDETIENSEIVKTINELEVPDEIKFPLPTNEPVDVAAQDADATAEAALADAETVKKPAPSVQPTASAPKVAVAKKAAKKAPSTPKTPKK